MTQLLVQLSYKEKTIRNDEGEVMNEQLIQEMIQIVNAKMILLRMDCECGVTITVDHEQTLVDFAQLLHDHKC